MVALNLKRYFTGESKAHKKTIVNELLRSMRDACPGSGGFVKDDPTCESAWVAIGSKETKEIIKNYMNDMVALLRESDDDSEKEKCRILMHERASSLPLSKSVAVENEMTPEQQKILRLLESGYDGPVDELLGMTD